MEPWQSWTAALVIGGGLFYYYSQGNNTSNKIARKMSESFESSPIASNRKRQVKQAVTKTQDAVSKASQKVADLATSATEATTSAAENMSKTSKKRKAGKENGATTYADKAASVLPTTSEDVEEDEEHDDAQDWAAQLSARQKGISLNAPAQSSKTNGRQQQASEAGSTKASHARTKGGVDVSDMLEPRAAAPGVLRVTGEEKAKKPQAPRAVQESQETKKQRQNKRKVEEQRLAREEQEKQRQTLLENQRLSLIHI